MNKIVKKVKARYYVALASTMMLLSTAPVGASQLGSELSNSENVVKSEATDASDAILGIGLVIIIVMFMVGVRDKAVKIAVCVLGGYFALAKLGVLKAIWKSITG